MNNNIKNYKFIQALQELSFIEEIWLFGSRSRGDNQPRSDIDLAVISPTATNEDWLRVTKIIDNADTLLKIDCLQFGSDDISKELHDNILKDKKVIYMKKLYWQDSFSTLGKALERLNEVILAAKREEDKDYIQDACIQRFEFSIELFWKTLKKILLHEKIDSSTPRDVLSKAYQYGLIDDENIWLQMLDDRNNTSHAYREERAKIIFGNIQKYLPIYQDNLSKTC